MQWDLLPVALSLTDSLEMAMEVERQCSIPPSFSCASDTRTGGKTFSADSYLASGSLKRSLLGLDPFPTDYEEDTIELFAFQWVTEMALVESCTILFGLFRQQIHKLENLIQSNSSDFGHAANLHCEAHKIRQQCAEFLQYVKVFIFRYLDPQEAEDARLFHPYEKQEAQLPSLLVEELHSLILHIGRLHELPVYILGGLTVVPQAKLFPPSWHLLHLHLDIHWSVLEILHILGKKLPRQTVYAHTFTNLTGENLTNISLFEEHCRNILCDLISLAAKRYTKVRPSEALTSHLYPCICVKELWILLIYLLDERSKESLTESFWNWLSKILKNMFERSCSMEKITTFESILCNDPLSFNWWIITHLASYYHIDRNGNIDEKKPIESNWPFVEDLLKQSISSQTTILEEQLRMHLQCCLTLSLTWNANLPTVTILWEYYSKNLNSPFSIPWFGLKGLANISKTALTMYELVKNCCSDVHTSDMYTSNNSYQFFLRILAQIIKKAVKTSGIHPWKQIKGRIYSKFHQKRMRELTEVGLQNLFHLFLILAAIAETEDVASRMMELLHFLSPVSTSIAQRALIWKGYFAFILMYVEKNMDISVLAEQVSNAFREKAKDFLVTKNDLMQKQNLWMLLSTYIDGVQEVFETSNYLQLSEEKLLNDGFSMLLPGCRGAELVAVLNFLQDVLFRLRTVHKHLNQGLLLGNTDPTPQPSSVAKEHHLAVARGLWRNFFPYLKSQRMMQTPPPQLADTAAGFTLLALDLPSTCTSDLQPQPVLTMMQLFGWDDMVCPQLVSRYLSHLMQNSELTETLTGVGHVSYQALLVRSWFRCVMQIYINQPADTLVITDVERTASKAYMEQLTELTRLILKLPEVGAVLSKTHVDESLGKQDPKEAVFQFIKAVGKNYSGLQTLSEKSAMVTKALEYLGDVLKYVKPYLMKKGSAEGLHLTYWIMGHLVKSWAPILVTSKAQQLLFRIIDCLLLPHAVLQQDKGLPAAMLSAIRENLPIFLEGLSLICYQSQTQGAYLNQLLGNIIQQYLGRFLPSSPSTSRTGQHPILLTICSSATTISATSHLRKATTQVICENYLQFKGHAPPPRLASVLAFVLEVLQKTKSTETCDIELLLPSVLKCLVLINEPQVKKLSTEILQCMVEGCQAGSGGKLATQLTSVFRQFIQDYTTVYDNQVYSILEAVAVLDQSLVISLIPAMTEALRNSEYKQGLGRNTVQREGYKRLLSQLTEAGQMEILKLENETH
ncbi:protein MMS22-like isoform X2 [Hemicordylus capensis]|uniref:protein MMS22-like isoform X2 n=1 Tax=Hemicordylus capensis TaxID=884348 RepID=UPI0023028AB7|nr:protein MMS22-like isoform X2 [Hemicordylus capensis]